MGQRGGAVVGILGGMGPWATLDLFRRILELTPARRDQDHLHLLIDSDPSVPDRTAAIVGAGPSPLKHLIEGVRRLATAGADVIAIPCNTAHHWIDELAAAVPVPIIDMVAETVAAVRALAVLAHGVLGGTALSTGAAPEPAAPAPVCEPVPGVRRVGLLATTGTLRSGIYGRRFQAHGIEVLAPPESVQRDLMGAIYGETGIKAGHLDEANRRRLAGAAARLVEAGAQALIAGCTEIPLVLRAEDVPVPLVDTLDCLARAVVNRACHGREKGVGHPGGGVPQRTDLWRRTVR